MPRLLVFFARTEVEGVTLIGRVVSSLEPVSPSRPMVTLGMALLWSLADSMSRRSLSVGDGVCFFAAPKAAGVVAVADVVADRENSVGRGDAMTSPRTLMVDRGDARPMLLRRRPPEDVDE